MSDIAAAARKLSGELCDQAHYISANAFARLAELIDCDTTPAGDEVRLRRMHDDMRWAVEAHPDTQITGIDTDCVKWYIEGMR